MDLVNELMEELEKSNITYQEAIAYSEDIQNVRVKGIIQYAINKHSNGGNTNERNIERNYS